MSPKTLHRRWSRRLELLQSRIERLYKGCRAAGDVESIHDLRVSIRRARLYAHVGRPLLRKGTVRQFDKWGRLINRWLGPIRDCDVCLNWLASHAHSLEIIQVVHEERARLWRLASQALHGKQYVKPVELRFHKQNKDHAEKLRERFDGLSRKVADRVIVGAAQAGAMNASELHRLRRHLRRWRYLRELSLSQRAQRTDVGLARLNKVQDALGESQNLQTTVQLLSELLGQAQQTKWIRRAHGDQLMWAAKIRRLLKRLPMEMV